MPKITFMGMGSTIFVRNVLGDTMCTPALAESEIALYDIDEQRLKESGAILDAINKGKGGKARIQSYLGEGTTPGRA
jgi:alpha-galactosidase